MKTHIASLVAKYEAIQRSMDLLSAKRDYIRSVVYSSKGEENRLSTRYAKALWPFDPHAVLAMPADINADEGILRKLSMDKSEMFDMWFDAEREGFINSKELTIEGLIEANMDKVKEMAPEAELAELRELWLEAKKRNELFQTQNEDLDKKIDDLRNDREAVGNELAPWLCPFRPNDIIIIDAEGGKGWVDKIRYSPESFLGFSLVMYKATAKGKGAREIYSHDSHWLLHLNPEIVTAHAGAMQRAWEMNNAPELAAAA